MKSSVYFGSVLLGLVLLLAVIPVSSAQDLTAGGNSEATKLQGTVINSVSREPIARALVFSTDNRYAALTDNQGRFEFQLTSANPKTETSTSDGMASSSFSITGPVGARKPGYFEGYASGRGDVTIALVPEALIVGRVSLPNATDQDRIVVSLYRRAVTDGFAHWAQVGSAVARSNGEFRFANLVAGIFKLHTNEMLDRDPLTADPKGPLYGYPPVYFPAATDWSSAASIRLSPGQTYRANLSPVRQPYYAVNIPVIGAPGANLNVVVSTHGQRGPGYSLGYDPRQRRIVGSLPDGSYTVQAIELGSKSVSGSVNVTVKGRATEGGALVMTAVGSIPIHVTNQFTSEEESAGGANARETLALARRHQPRLINAYLLPVEDFGAENITIAQPTSSQPDSPITFESAAPGRYWLKLDPSRGYASSLRWGTIDLFQQPLVAGAGNTTPIEVVLRDDFATMSGTVEGLPTSTGPRVVNSEISGASFGPALVYCIPLPDSTGQFREVPVERDGSFSAQLAPGTYRVLAFTSQRPELEWRNPEAMQAYETLGQVVRLSAGQTEQVRLSLGPASE